MQQALQVQTKVDQMLVNAIPALKPLLGHRVQVIALDLEGPTGAEVSGDVSGSQDVGAVAQLPGSLSLDEFLATRQVWPKDRPPLTLEEIEAGIAQGAIHYARSTGGSLGTKGCR